jgi:DNA polymerase III subunit epsilon
MNYTAIDIETATSKRWSICQIGIVKVENFCITEEKLLNIKPPDNKYDVINTMIHGMSCKDTECESYFHEKWDIIKPHIEGQLVVAHNVNFDINSLQQTLEFYNINVPSIKSFCTYQATGFKLIDICNSYGIVIEHHNALSDARACAQIYKMLCLGEFKSELVKKTDNSKSKTEYHEKISSQLLKPDFTVSNCNNPFFKKKVVITGVFSNISRNEIAEILKNKGADIDSSVTIRTSFIISGKEPGPSKIQKAQQLNIPILTEKEFNVMIK